jgi:hypothetical protein
MHRLMLGCSEEPTFCDGYTNAVSNRTVFPLKGGIIELNSEHDTWDSQLRL